MLLAWHPKRWRDLCMSEDKKKKKESNEFQILLSNALVFISSIQYSSAGHFVT